MSDLKSLKDNTAKTPETSSPAAGKSVDAKATLVAETKTAAPVAAAPAPALPTPAPVPVQAAPALTVPPANVVASAAPTARPVPPKESVATSVTVLTREQPDFPRDAVRAGIELGNVRARVVINAAGGVSSVVILEARPLRVFDRSVIQALQKWKFNPGTDGRTYETEISFKVGS